VAHEAPTRLDVLTRHRLRILRIDADGLLERPVGERLDEVYRGFLARVPYENLSNNRCCLESPGDPDGWTRPTDRLLRENRDQGLGGTSFSLAYALRDLFRGVGGNAHLTLGKNLVTEEMHAAVVVYAEGDPRLYDPALLVGAPLPVRPGGCVEEPLGVARLEAASGATLTLLLQESDSPRLRPVYQVVPLPASPASFRQAWLASFHRGRPGPLRLARRVGDEIRRYLQRSGRVEILRPGGRTSREIVGCPVRCLHETFGIAEPCLSEWFERPPRAGRA
jgi:hypothetical protein